MVQRMWSEVSAAFHNAQTPHAPVEWGEDARFALRLLGDALLGKAAVDAAEQRADEFARRPSPMEQLELNLKAATEAREQAEAAVVAELKQAEAAAAS